jgi:hypothetical protein
MTAVDCYAALGQVCLDGGSCGVPSTLPSLACGITTEACGAGFPPCCQGSCSDAGTCLPWAPCGSIGSTCQNQSDCCLNESCDAGTCAASCGTLADPCTVDSDCCEQMGLICLASQASGNPFECQAIGGGLSCTPLPTVNSEECDLGTACRVAANGTDPCNPAGYVCDAFLEVCRQPLIYEACVPGGPPCQGVESSTVDDLVCITQTNNTGHTYSSCLQPCRLTSDCIRGTTSCASVGNQGFACFGDYDGCTNYFGPCNAMGANDGTCTPIKLGSTVVGKCIQADVDAGATCSVNRNRQNGGFCSVGEACVSEIGRAHV